AVEGRLLIHRGFTGHACRPHEKSGLGNCAEIRREIDAGSFALRELWEAQERRVPDSGAFGYDMEDRNASDWTLAGQLQLEYVGKLFVNGDPKWQTEAAD